MTDGEIERINVGDAPFTIEPVGGTETKWIVDAEMEGSPTPRQFRDLGVANTKLVVLASFLPKPYDAEALRLFQDVSRLQRMLARERLDDDHDVASLCLGNLDVLPEVEAEREYVSYRDEEEDDG